MTDNDDLRRQAADAIHRHRCNADCPHGPIRYDYAEADAVLAVVADWLDGRRADEHRPSLTATGFHVESVIKVLADQMRKAIG